MRIVCLANNCYNSGNYCQCVYAVTIEIRSPSLCLPLIGYYLVISGQTFGFSMKWIPIISNPSLAEHDMPCFSKQCRARSVDF